MERVANMLGEVWRQYENTPYYFSNCGRVKRKYKNHEKLLSPYSRVRKKNGKTQSYTYVHIHRKQVKVAHVICKLFIGDIPKGYCVHHKDNCFFNNDYRNLELLTKSELGKKTGKRHRRTRKIIDLDTGKIYKGTRECAKALYTSRQTVSDICNKKRKRKPMYNLAWCKEE